MLPTVTLNIQDGKKKKRNRERQIPKTVEIKITTLVILSPKVFESHFSNLDSGSILSKPVDFSAEIFKAFCPILRESISPAIPLKNGYLNILYFFESNLP